FYWFSLEPQRTGAPQADGQAEPDTLRWAGRWEELLRGEGREVLEDILPAYVGRAYWYWGGERYPEAVRVLQAVPVATAELALAPVEYSAGDAETCILPVAFAEGPEAERLLTQYPRAVVARVIAGRRRAADADQAGVLFDPVAERAFLRELAEIIVHQRLSSG